MCLDQGLYMPRLGIEPTNLGMCSDQESNMQPFIYQTVLQPTQSHQPGQISLSLVTAFPLSFHMSLKHFLFLF